MPRTRASLFVQLPLVAATLLVELAEDIGDLTPEEAATVADVRRRIERIAEAAKP